MLKTIGYEDMAVVKEFTEGSHLLVGACDVTGLSPKKFAPGTMTIDGLQCTAAKDRELQSHLHVGVGDADVQLNKKRLERSLAPSIWRMLMPPSHLAEDSECSKGRRFDVLTISLAQE